MKLILIFSFTFIVKVHCFCLLPDTPNSVKRLKEEYLDLVLRSDGRLDRPYGRPFCLKEEQILWSFRGTVVAMPDELRSAMLNARKKGLSWASYEAQAKNRKTGAASMRTSQCGLLGRRQRTHVQLMEDYLDLVLMNRGKLIRPQWQPLCIDEEQMMWIFREKLEMMSSQLRSDILDARRNGRSWLDLLRSKRKTSGKVKTDTIEKKQITAKTQEKDRMLNRLRGMLRNAKTKSTIRTTIFMPERTTKAIKETTTSSVLKTDNKLVDSATLETIKKTVFSTESKPGKQLEESIMPEIYRKNTSSTELKLRNGFGASESSETIEKNTLPTKAEAGNKSAESVPPDAASETALSTLLKAGRETMESGTPGTVHNVTLSSVSDIESRFGESETLESTDKIEASITPSTEAIIFPQISETTAAEDKSTKNTESTTTPKYIRTTILAISSSSEKKDTSILPKTTNTDDLLTTTLKTTVLMSTLKNISETMEILTSFNRTTTTERTTKSTKTTISRKSCLDPSGLYDLEGNSVDFIPMPRPECMK